MRKRGAFLVLFLFIGLAFFAWGVYASEFDLEISANDNSDDGLSNFSTSFTAQIESGADSGFDGFDFPNPSTSLPSGSSSLYSSVEGNELVVDSWQDASETRAINLTYENSPQTPGTLNLTWDYSNSSITVNLTDYGADSSYTSAVSSFHMDDYSSYVVAGSSGVRYLSIRISPVVVVVEEETGSGDNGGGGGGGGGGLATWVSQLFELVAPVHANFITGASIGGEYSFSYSGGNHKIRIIEVKDNTAKVRVESLPQEKNMKTGDLEEFDLNDDGKSDIYVKIISISGSSVRYEFGPIEFKNVLSVSPKDISLNLIEDKEEVKEIVLKNIGSEKLKLAVELDAISSIIKLSTNLIEINPGESKTLFVTFNPSRKSVLGGLIKFVQNGQIMSEIPVLINVKSENFLFDVALSIPSSSRVVSSGGNVKAQINMQEVANQVDKVDVVATYTIKDFEGRIYAQESETFYVLNSKDYVKDFSTFDLPAGKYILGMEITYPGAFAVSSAQFEVSNKPIFANFWPYAAALIIVIGVILFSLYMRARRTSDYRR